MYSMGLLLIVLVLIDLRLGSIRISLGEMLGHLWGGEELSDQQLVILTKFRLPRLATALLAGAALPACGLQMQTLFRNPLAGPYVLGISSGASFGAALVVLGAGATARVLQSQLYQVGTLDPLTFASVAVGFVVAGVSASLLPARRATRVDPVRAMQVE